MRTSSIATLVGVCSALWGCPRPAYEATPEGQLLTEWTAPPPTQTSGATVTGELTSPAGTRYRLEAAMGQAGDKLLPATVRIELVANPAHVQVEVRCGDPMHFATEPTGHYSAVCEAFERSGSESLLRSSIHQDRHVLRVVGDGRILLEAGGSPP